MITNNSNEKIENYEFGKTYTNEIPKEEADKFANIFGEGSPALTELIKYCILNGIITRASCKGHPEKRNVLEKILETGYITFQFDINYDENDFAYFLASIPSTNKHITAYLESNMSADRTITFYVPAKLQGESEQYFILILEQLKKYKMLKDNNEAININPEIKKIVDYAFDTQIGLESFEITQSTYKKYKRYGGQIKKIAKCPAENKTNKLHTLYSDYLKELREKHLDDFINYTR